MPPSISTLQPKAEALVRGIGIPPCPEILAELNREVRAETPDVCRIASLIARDAATAAAMLKLVNSPFYGLRTKADSVQQALAYLGLDRAAILLAGLLLRKAFAVSHKPAMARFWADSSGLALVLSHLARHVGRLDRDQAHTFGLFRDAGSALLIARYDDYPAVADRAEGASLARIAELEKAHYGVDHAVIGAVLAKEWGLPDSLSEAILWHHVDGLLALPVRPLPEASVRFIALGYLGDAVLAGRSRRAGADTERMHELVAQGAPELGVSPREWVALHADASVALSDQAAASVRTVRLRPVTAAASG